MWHSPHSIKISVNIREVIIILLVDSEAKLSNISQIQTVIISKTNGNTKQESKQEHRRGEPNLLHRAAT
jgi:hypothetical protein